MIYLDNNATTRPTPNVVEAVNRSLTELWPNPSSVHRAGQEVRRAIEIARTQVAKLIGAKAREITFLSGGTESINLAIRGVLAAKPDRNEVITTLIEHSAIRTLLEDLSDREQAFDYPIPLGPGGLVSLHKLEQILDASQNTALVTIQWANNETGVVQPIKQIAELCHKYGALFHCDATQWVGKMPTDVSTAGIDLMTFSPHKFHGPKGIGMLWTRRGVKLRPVTPGSQELGRRGGTENVPGILGAGAACQDAATWLNDESARNRIASLRDQLEHSILEQLPIASVNGSTKSRLWNTTNIGFAKLEAEALLILLSERGLCASAGAACSSGSLEPSPVLLAMGIPEEIAHGSVRFTLSRYTTEQEIEEAIKIVVQCVSRLQSSSAASL